jgi:hypothetical protein
MQEVMELNTEQQGALKHARLALVSCLLIQMRCSVSAGIFPAT